ncbi:unnamed protein product, partial [Prorocentrum cordatum]
MADPEAQCEQLAQRFGRKCMTLDENGVEGAAAGGQPSGLAASAGPHPAARDASNRGLGVMFVALDLVPGQYLGGASAEKLTSLGALLRLPEHIAPPQVGARRSGAPFRGARLPRLYGTLKEWNSQKAGAAYRSILSGEEQGRGVQCVARRLTRFTAQRCSVEHITGMRAPVSAPGSAAADAALCPARCRALAIAPQGGEEVVRLLEAAGGRAAVVVPPERWPELRRDLAQRAGVEWGAEREEMYEPLWFVDRAQVEHLTAPLRACDARGRPLCAYLRGAQEALTPLSAALGAFDRVLDCRGLARGEQAALEQQVRQLMAFMLPGAEASRRRRRRSASGAQGGAAAESPKKATREEREPPLSPAVAFVSSVLMVSRSDCRPSAGRPARCTRCAPPRRSQRLARPHRHSALTF